MIQKIGFVLIFALLGMLATGWWHNRARIYSIHQVQEQAKIQSFMAKGARFTAQDGQQLCERVRALEQHSYGYQNAGLKPLACEYGAK